MAPGDITRLPGPAMGIWYHAYVIIDVFSRNIGHTVELAEAAERAEGLIRETIECSGIVPRTVHADRGTSMTRGKPNYNRELYCPDWMHLIRSQAFANLWLKALKAHEECLAAVRTMGTDELHVVGNWPRFFTEGRGGTKVKVKNIYTAKAAGGEALQPGEGGVSA